MPPPGGRWPSEETRANPPSGPRIGPRKAKGCRFASPGRSFGQPAFDQVCELRLQLHPDPFPSPVTSRDQRGTGACIRIEHHVAGAARNLHTSPGQSERHDCRMVVHAAARPLTGLGGNVPCSAQSTPVRTPNRIDVVVVILALGQQEHGLMRPGWPVTNRFRVGVRLVPDDFGAEPPAILLKRERQPPGYSNQILGFEPFRGGRSNGHGASPVLSIRRSIAAVARRIDVTRVQPYRPVVGKNPPNLVKRLYDACNIVLQGVVPPGLIFDFIISQ